MELLDARRLTGPNVLMDLPGTVIDVACSDDERQPLLRAWSQHVERMLTALGWSAQTLHHRMLTGGISLAFTAPIDVLYAATAVNEWAYAASEAQLHGTKPPDEPGTLTEIRAAAAEEANPSLLALAAAAATAGQTLLWDDDEVSLGTGRHARTWPARELPDPAVTRTLTFDGADSYGSSTRIPIGLITGTNGKTTTVRLARHIARCAGYSPGLTSTDWIAVDDEIVERGDWSGPGGARTVLRHHDVDPAILETARGGLLRRGLGVQCADAALITNIAEDHLGDFGSRTIDELLAVKWVVSRVVRESGTLVLNADDPRLVARAETYDGRLVWFSMDAANPVIARHTQSGGTAFVLAGGELRRLTGDTCTAYCEAESIPIALKGAARHNLANSLAASALSDSLHVSLESIRDGLCSMSQHDNPGRCNVYELPQCRVLVDFAHNPHAMQALFDMAQALPARRRLLAFSQAGDRTNAQIRELAESAWSIGLDYVVVSELAKYHRGREEGEVFALIRKALLSAGAREDQIEHYEHETESLEACLNHARPGDLVIMLALGDSNTIRQRLESLSGHSI